MEPEITVHQCTPSQISNLNNFVFAFLGVAAIVALYIVTDSPVVLVLLILPLAFAFWKWLKIKTTKFTLTDQRLIVSNGIFTKKKQMKRSCIV